MVTTSNGNIFRVTGLLCWEFTGNRWMPCTKASDAELKMFFFYLPLNKWLSKQSWVWWFETPSRSLWRHCNRETTLNFNVVSHWLNPHPEWSLQWLHLRGFRWKTGGLWNGVRPSVLPARCRQGHPMCQNIGSCIVSGKAKWWLFVYLQNQ